MFGELHGRYLAQIEIQFIDEANQIPLHRVSPTAQFPHSRDSLFLLENYKNRCNSIVVHPERNHAIPK